MHVVIKDTLTDIVSAIVVQITSLCMTFLVHTSSCVIRQRSTRYKNNNSVMYLTMKCDAIYTSVIIFKNANFLLFGTGRRYKQVRNFHNKILTRDKGLGICTELSTVYAIMLQLMCCDNWYKCLSKI